MWEDLAPAENILIFQNDAILCSNAVRSVDDFFEWDMIGAPVAPRWGHGYNGGLSLRKRSLGKRSLRKRSSTLRVIDRFEWSDYGGMRAEDQWYFGRLVCSLLFWDRQLTAGRLTELMEEDENEGREASIKLPSMKIARTFAVETLDYPTPVGFQ